MPVRTPAGRYGSRLLRRLFQGVSFREISASSSLEGAWGRPLPPLSVYQYLVYPYLVYKYLIYKYLIVFDFPHTEEPHTEEPYTEEPHTEEPHAEEPHTENLHTVDRPAGGFCLPASDTGRDRRRSWDLQMIKIRLIPMGEGRLWYNRAVYLFSGCGGEPMSITRRYIAVNGFEIYWYGVLIALGAALAVFAANRRAKRLGLPADSALDVALAVLPAGFAGARLYYVLMRPELFHSLKDFFDLRSGGLAVYGGVVAGILAGYVYARVKRRDFVRLADMALPCVALAQSVGRWGNFLNEEAYGEVVSAGWLKFFPVSVFIRETGEYHAAAFFYESAWCLLIFLLICVLPCRRRFDGRGAGALAYAAMYAFERCAVEGLRLDSLYIGPVRASQLLSAAVLAAVCLYLLVRAEKKAPLLAAWGISALAVLLSALALLPARWLYAFLPVQGILAVTGFRGCFFKTET